MKQLPKFTQVVAMKLWFCPKWLQRLCHCCPLGPGLAQFSCYICLSPVIWNFCPGNCCIWIAIWLGSIWPAPGLESHSWALPTGQSSPHIVTCLDFQHSYPTGIPFRFLTPQGRPQATIGRLDWFVPKKPLFECPMMQALDLELVSQWEEDTLSRLMRSSQFMI